MRTRWTNELLNALRHVGDPWMDDNFSAVADGLAPQREEAEAEAEVSDEILTANADPKKPPIQLPPVTPAHGEWRPRDEGAATYWETAYDWEERLDPEDVEIAQDLFVRHGQEIGACLLLASLPQSYAVEAGARVLERSSELRSNPRRRILATSEFLLNVMLEDEQPNRRTAEDLRSDRYPVDPRLSLLPNGPGYLAARRTRFIHGAIRAQLQDHHDPGEIVGGRPMGVPVSQEFQLGTYLSFCVTVWESLERLGIRWTIEEKQAYLRVWDWVAHLMGIGTTDVAKSVDAIDRPTDEIGTKERRRRDLRRFGSPSERILRPDTVAEAEHLMEIIRDRNWPPREETGAFQCPAGKKLIHTLLTELESAMPTLMQSLPMTVMRYLADQRVTVALGLGGGGLPPVLLDWTQERTRARRMHVNPILAPSMRAAANQVSLHAYTDFIRTGPFTFPGAVGGRSTMVRGRSKKSSMKAQEKRVEALGGSTRRSVPAEASRD